MTILPRFLFLIFIAIGPLTLYAQATVENPENIYGYDPLLYNGMVYTYSPPDGTVGNQYLFGKFDTAGSVTLRGVCYKGISINYDTYNQKVVLEYKNKLGTSGFIEISTAWLEKFDLYGRHFEIDSAIAKTNRIYQVLGDGADRIIYFHLKKMNLDSRAFSSAHFYAEDLREMYVKTDNRTLRFKNNRSFITAFNKSRQDAIKKYMRKHKIKVKIANDTLMTELINYCNTLPEK